ncbi:MAG: rod shape-determining protein MreC [Phycisphaerales bacterium]
MARKIAPSKRAFRVAIAFIGILAILPNRWLRPWTSDLAAVVNVPLEPFEYAGTKIRQWIRPTPDPLSVETEQVQRLIEDRDEVHALYRAAQLRVEALEQEISELQDAQRFHRGGNITPVFAHVTGRSPGRGGGPLRLRAGTREGVTPNTIAVYRGVHLIGHVTNDVRHLSSRLLPLTDRAARWVTGIILSADDPTAPISDAPRVDLKPLGNGTLSGEIERARDVRPGDLVRLADPSWPDSAQGMIIGYVKSVAHKDDDPLRDAVVVEPRYLAADLDAVTLKIEQRQKLDKDGES